MKNKTKFTPYDATLKGWDAGAASIRLELDNGTIKVYHGEDGDLLLHISEVRNGTWDTIWDILKSSGKQVQQLP